MLNALGAPSALKKIHGVSFLLLLTAFSGCIDGNGDRPPAADVFASLTESRNADLRHSSEGIIAFAAPLRLLKSTAYDGSIEGELYNDTSVQMFLLSPDLEVAPIPLRHTSAVPGRYALRQQDKSTGENGGTCLDSGSNFPCPAQVSSQERTKMGIRTARENVLPPGNWYFTVLIYHAKDLQITVEFSEPSGIGAWIPLDAQYQNLATDWLNATKQEMRLCGIHFCGKIIDGVYELTNVQADWHLVNAYLWARATSKVSACVEFNSGKGRECASREGGLPDPVSLRDSQFGPWTDFHRDAPSQVRLDASIDQPVRAGFLMRAGVWGFSLPDL